MGLTPFGPSSQSCADLVLSSDRIGHFRLHLIFSMPATALLPCPLPIGFTQWSRSFARNDCLAPSKAATDYTDFTNSSASGTHVPTHTN
jgi:hypothetical protein